MNDAVRYLVAALVGYAAGALHVWFAQAQREGSAYMDGYRDGQRVSGQRRERDNG